MEPRLFFRILYTPQHIKWWNQRRFFSTNEPHGLPNAWQDALVAGLPADQFPLETAGVVFLPCARDEVAQQGTALIERWGSLEQPIRERMLEIGGVSAYQDPVHAYWHGGVRPEEWQQLVAFYGYEVCVLAPEAAFGAVIAAVVKPLQSMTPQQFLDEYFGGVEPPNPHVPSGEQVA